MTRELTEAMKEKTKQGLEDCHVHPRITGGKDLGRLDGGNAQGGSHSKDPSIMGIIDNGTGNGHEQCRQDATDDGNVGYKGCGNGHAKQTLVASFSNDHFSFDFNDASDLFRG